MYAGRYHLTSCVASTDRASIFLAHDDLLDIDVALKVVEAAVPNAIVRANTSMLRHEAMIAMRLNDPRFVRARGMEREPGSEALVLDYVAGESLETHVQREFPHRVPVERAMSWVHQLLDAMAYAHGIGVHHLNLCPENLIVTSDDRLVICDFGAATAIGSAPPPSPPTAVPYLSPEQMVGDQGDARSDVYAIAAIAFSLVHGSPPFGRSGLGVAQSQRHGKVQDSPWIPSSWSHWLRRALHPNPCERPPNAAALREEIAQPVALDAVNHEPITVADDVTSEDVVRSWAIELPDPSTVNEELTPDDFPEDEALVAFLRTRPTETETERIRAALGPEADAPELGPSAASFQLSDGGGMRLSSGRFEPLGPRPARLKTA